jgi:uncharacterized protein YfeS
MIAAFATAAVMGGIAVILLAAGEVALHRENPRRAIDLFNAAGDCATAATAVCVSIVLFL